MRLIIEYNKQYGLETDQSFSAAAYIRMRLILESGLQSCYGLTKVQKWSKTCQIMVKNLLQNHKKNLPILARKFKCLKIETFLVIFQKVCCTIIFSFGLSSKKRCVSSEKRPLKDDNGQMIECSITTWVWLAANWIQYYSNAPNKRTWTKKTLFGHFWSYFEAI